jgi:hypothetical protein
LKKGGNVVKCTYLRTVPSSYAHVSSDLGESGNVGLGLPVVPGDETVGAVGAGQRGQGAAAIVVAGVVADGDGGSKADKAKDGSGDGTRELHDVDGRWVKVW